MRRDAPAIAWLDETDHREIALLGGKCAGLAEMIQAGFGVPDAFAVTTAGFWGFLERTGLLEEVRALRADLDVADLPAVEAASAAIAGRFEAAAVPEDLERDIHAAYAQIARRAGVCDVPVAVRSSCVAEDLAGASFAGQYETYLWVRGADELIDHVKRCWAGLFGCGVLTYQPGAEASHLHPDGPGIAVGVQRMVDARAAGVMLTLDPVTGDRAKIVVEAAWGLGEGVVSGELTPDRFCLDKVTRSVVDRRLAHKEREYRFVDGRGVVPCPVDEPRRDEPSLDDEHLDALAQLARRIERHRRAPQDIEWAIDGDGNVHVLQVRPETIWSRREAQPVAKPAASAVDMVLRGLVGGAA